MRPSVQLFSWVLYVLTWNSIIKTHVTVIDFAMSSYLISTVIINPETHSSIRHFRPLLRHPPFCVSQSGGTRPYLADGHGQTSSATEAAIHGHMVVTFKYSAYRILWLSPCDKITQNRVLWLFPNVILVLKNYRPVTIFWPCPEVVIISDKHCIKSPLIKLNRL